MAADGMLILSVSMVADLQERVLLSTHLNVRDPFSIFADRFE